jgi:hypothetical protein
VNVAAELQRQASLIRQLQGAGAGLSRAAGFVTGGGGTTYTLTSASSNVVSVTGISTGRAQIVLDAAAASGNNIYPVANCNDNADRSATIGIISASPITFDVYQWTTAGAAVNRSFFFVVEFFAV